jgi:hypothetical protein
LVDANLSASNIALQLIEAVRQGMARASVYFDRLNPLALDAWLELENFSGQSVEAVRQDFFSRGFLSNVESVLSGPAQEALTAGEAHRLQRPPPRRVSSLCRSLNYLRYKKKHVF